MAVAGTSLFPVAHLRRFDYRSTQGRSLEQGASRNRHRVEARALTEQPTAGGAALDLLSDACERTLQFIERKRPEWTALLPLALSSSLFVHERRMDYSERREDYREPQLIVVLGTSHVSGASELAAAQVIDATSPDVVVVELCRSRAFRLSDEGPQANVNPWAWGSSGGGYAAALRRAIDLGGVAAVALRPLLAATTGRATQLTGVRPGAEFLAAAKAASRVGASIVLGDRPVEITLARCWAALGGPLAQLRAVGALLAVAAMPDAAAAAAARAAADTSLGLHVSSMDSAAGASSLLAAFTTRYPSLVAPLVTERDAYLAWSLKRSKAVCGARVVVGVMGRAHVPGVLAALRADVGGDVLSFATVAAGGGRGKLGIDALVALAVEGAAFAAAYGVGGAAAKAIAAWVGYGPL